MSMGQRDLFGFWMAVAILIGYCLWAIDAPCYSCGNPCATTYGCDSGCVCAFAEDDDNEHNGTCVRGR